MSFECADGSLGDVVSMNVWGHKLECASPRVLCGLFVGLDGLVVQDLQVNGVAALFEAIHNAVVCHNAMAVLFGAEGLYKDDIAAAVVSQHNM